MRTNSAPANSSTPHAAPRTRLCYWLTCSMPGRTVSRVFTSFAVDIVGDMSVPKLSLSNQTHIAADWSLTGAVAHAAAARARRHFALRVHGGQDARRGSALHDLFTQLVDVHRLLQAGVTRVGAEPGRRGERVRWLGAKRRRRRTGRGVPRGRRGSRGRRARAARERDQGCRGAGRHRRPGPSHSPVIDNCPFRPECVPRRASYWPEGCAHPYFARNLLLL